MESLVFLCVVANGIKVCLNYSISSSLSVYLFEDVATPSIGTSRLRSAGMVHLKGQRMVE